MPYYSVAELNEFEQAGNVIHAPHSTLVSRGVHLGTGNVFFPNVVLTCAEGSSFTVGDDNVFYPNFFGEAAGDGSSIAIADGSEIGPGLVVLRANAPGSRLRIGSRCRLVGHVELFGRTTVGDGAQVLGSTTTLINVTLAGGADHRHPDYDARGAVAKGAQTIKDLVVPTGMSALPPARADGTTRLVAQRTIHS
jgi:hypothetical protein